MVQEGGGHEEEAPEDLADSGVTISSKIVRIIIIGQMGVQNGPGYLMKLANVYLFPSRCDFAISVHLAS